VRDRLTTAAVRWIKLVRNIDQVADSLRNDGSEYCHTFFDIGDGNTL